MRLYVGTSGFSYKPWKGPFYPADLPDDEMLGYYSRRLPSVEINNTFYRMPKTELLARWRDATPDAFRFAIKAPQRITHRKRLKGCADDVAYVFDTLAAMGERLGPTLFQLPPNQKADAERLREFLTALPAGRRVAFEFRHPSWFDSAVFEALRAAGAALCVADAEDADKTAPLEPTASWGYLRLRREDYDDAALRGWAERILAQRWSDAFVYFKHEDAGAGPRLAARLRELIEAPAGSA